MDIVIYLFMHGKHLFTGKIKDKALTKIAALTDFIRIATLTDLASLEIIILTQQISNHLGLLVTK